MRHRPPAPFRQSRGSLIEHAGLRDFIQRNYAADADGAWYFQNGPQRVYVELEAGAADLAPGARRPAGRSRSRAIAAVGARFDRVLSDEHGRVFIATDLGLGLVHSLDMEIVADQVESGRWQVESVRCEQLPQRFGFVLEPGRGRCGRLTRP